MKTPLPPESQLSPTPSPGAASSVRAAPGGDAAASFGRPQRFGKYTLLRKLATGGMAELFLALQRSVAGFEKLVVIKRILPRLNQDRAFIEMLLHEARVVATLSHPNIVHVFDLGQVDGTYFIAMEHVHGEDIRSIARQMRRTSAPSGEPGKPREFSREHALRIVLGICAGLSYAHEKRDLDGTALNIVHCDVSPQNVLVTFSGDIKIIDFGIAKSERALHADTTGKLRGKVPYMSPEQARGEPLDARSDIFSTGVILFELTTGHRLFKTSSEYETLRAICERDYPRPSDLVAGYPPALEAIVMRALCRDREGRFPTARALQAALEDFVRSEQLVVSPIGLAHFMHTLFAEKLVSQKEALLYGRQLAEAIEPGGEGPASDRTDRNDRNEKEFGGAHLSMPAASHTVTSSLPGIGRAFPWAFAGTAGTAMLVVLFGAAFYANHAKRGAPPPTATVSESPAAGVGAPSTPAVVSESPQPAGVPARASGFARAAAPATGKLDVAAAGGTCTVAIDGKAFGPTPLSAIELPAGAHEVACTALGGKTQSATIQVPAAGAVRHRFAL
ncbi:serine/threonine protein kinase [Pendulispora albinea]|uniref:Protein kinase n=1 Tax=Pendulispora albinea TaxID=2741071 RepID=A0ABZ2M0K4_9BACT